jgi:endonuclease-3
MPRYPLFASSPRWAELDARLRAAIAERRPRAAKVERAHAIAATLRREFPDAACALHYTNALELLVATILSAQCTDERVNMVTPALFAKYRNAAEYAAAPEGELEALIHSTGFFNSKAKAIRAMAHEVHTRFGGEVPAAMEELLTLRGVARKTANVVRANAFGLPGITVDTHFTRIMGRLGLTKEEDPEKIEFDVAALLPPEEFSHFSHAVILHGRKTCQTRKPKCGQCPLAALCPSRGEPG